VSEKFAITYCPFDFLFLVTKGCPLVEKVTDGGNSARPPGSDFSERFVHKTQFLFLLTPFLFWIT